MKLHLITGARLNASHGGGLEEWIRSFVRHVPQNPTDLDIFSYGLSEDTSEETLVHCTRIKRSDIPSHLSKPSNIVVFTNYEDLLLHQAAVTSQKTIMVFHGNAEEELKLWYSGWRWALKRLQLRKQIKHALKKASCVVTVSKWMKEWLVATAPTETKKIHVIYNCIPESILNMPHYHLNDSSALFTLGSMNMLNSPHRMKDFKLLCEVIETLQKNNIPVQVKLVGGFENSALFKQAQSLAKHLPIYFLGFQQEPWTHFKDIDVFFHPSTLDSFSITTLSAMALGYPIVASDVGGIPEVIGEAGLVGGTKDQLTSHITRLYQNEKMRERLSSLAHERAKTTFGSDKFQTSWRGLLQI